MTNGAQNPGIQADVDLMREFPRNVELLPFGPMKDGATAVGKPVQLPGVTAGGFLMSVYIAEHVSKASKLRAEMWLSEDGGNNYSLFAAYERASGDGMPPVGKDGQPALWGGCSCVYCISDKPGMPEGKPILKPFTDVWVYATLLVAGGSFNSGVCVGWL